MSAGVHELNLLTVREASALLRQSERSIRRKVHAGLIPALRLGDTGPLRVPLTALENHLQPVSVDGSPAGGSFAGADPAERHGTQKLGESNRASAVGLSPATHPQGRYANDRHSQSGELRGV
jgi:excisionase family DNA binding protein